MRRQTRLLLALAALLGLFFLLLWGSSQLTILKSFEGIEEERIVRNFARVMDAISVNLEELSRQAGDYAEWDDTYRFIVDRNPEYIRSNLLINTYENLNLTLFQFIGPDGALVHGKVYSPSSQTLHELPPGVISYFRSVHGRAAVREGARGLLRLSDGVLLLAVRPILTSQGRGPSRGAVVMGRYLDAAAVEKLERITHSVPEFSPPDQDRRLPGWVLGCSAAQLPMVSRTDEQVMASGVVLALDGAPALAVRVRMPRDIVGQGRQAVIYFICVSMATSLALSLAGYFFYSKLTVTRDEKQASESRYRSLFDHAPVALWEEDYSAVKVVLDQLRVGGVVDFDCYFQDNPDELRRCAALVRVVDVNEAALNLYRAGSKEELRARLAEIFTDCSRELFRQVLVQMARGETFFTGEDTKTTLTGETIHVHLTWTAAPGYAQSYGRIYASDLDITARKNLEEQLRQSQKMEAVGQLAGGIAHDFNNILTVIIGFGHLLQTATGTDDVLAEYSRQILAAAERAANLTQGLLAFSRRQFIALQPVELNGLIRSFSVLLQRIIGEDVELILALSPESLPVRADQGQIEQVLMNLAANARDAMPRGGTLTIATGTVLIDQHFVSQHGSGEPGSYACFTVRDTGEGMDERTRKRVFEPFFTTKEVGKGTGLGLSIVYGVVKQHNGLVSIISEPGQGTACAVYLPLLPQETICSAESAVLVASGGVETLLLAEDDEAVRGYLRRLLEGNGYTVLEAGDGEEALVVVAAAPGPLDLVILDVVMPKKNGREVYDVLRRTRPGLPIIFISGYPLEVISRNGILDQDVHLVAKPVKPVELLAAVRDALSRSV
jgi:signal transduction histidine kinase/sensor domain CHASE-containing protein/CheY-like chemotaxis protein